MAINNTLDLLPVECGEEHGDESVRFEEDEVRLVSTMSRFLPRFRVGFADDYKELMKYISL